MKVLFLDRDGIVNVDTGHTHKISDFKFVDGAPELIKKYNDLRHKVVVITNQAGIAKKYFGENDMHRFHRHIDSELAKYAARVDAYYFCPHHPDFTGKCNCRKPAPGMIFEAQKDFDIDLENSILVGDKESDMGAGANAGIKRLVFLRGNYEVDEKKTQATEIIDSLRDIV